ncbi:helix-turn-helix transcriptional regulator [Streptomyces sp. NPDC046862]|uniref:helix-turn-helix transcriptional regulator n=1 Tax=Streptomyces sp. NPDC046862 TaxID=3154603 RepID=UPI0034517D1E
MGRRRQPVDPAAPQPVRELALRLREAAEAAGFASNSELAKACGLGETVVSETLRAARAPTPETLKKVLAACGIDPDQKWERLRFKAQAADQQRRAEVRETDRQTAARSAVTGAHRSAAQLQRRHLLLRGRVHLGPDGDLPYVGAVRDRALLRIHPAPPVRARRGDVVLDPELPSYVERERDGELRLALAHARDQGGLVLVQGPSAAGKSRAAAEAMWSCLPGWQLLIPVSSEDLAPLSDPQFDLSRTIVWLNDFQLHLGPGGAHVHTLHRLLAHPSRPVLLATIRSSERAALRDDSTEGGRQSNQDRPRADSLTLVQALLDRAQTVALERLFTTEELERAKRLEGDPRIAATLPGTHRFGLAELLAAGPELRDLLEAHTNDADGQFAGAALVHAAVDCARAGWSRPVPLNLLRPLTLHYIPAELRSDVTPEDLDAAVNWATRRRRGYSRLLIPSADDRHALSAFDYLVDDAQAQRDRAVPDTVWRVLAAAADPETALTLGERALTALAIDTAEIALRKALDSAIPDIAASAAERLSRLYLTRGQGPQADPLLRHAASLSPWARGHLDEYLVGIGMYDDVLDRWTAETDVRKYRRGPEGLFTALTARARWTDLERLLAERNSSGPARHTLQAELRVVKRLRWIDPTEQLAFRYPFAVFSNVRPGESQHRSWWRRRIAALLEQTGLQPTIDTATAANGKFEAEKDRLLRMAVQWDDGRSLYGWNHLLLFLWSHGHSEELGSLLHGAAASGVVGVDAVLEQRRQIARRIAAPVLPPYPDSNDDLAPELQREFGRATEHADPRPTGQLGQHLTMMFHELHPGLAGRTFTEREAQEEADRTGHDMPILEFHRRAGQWGELLDRWRPTQPAQLWPGFDRGYYVLAHVGLGQWQEAESIARRAFEAGQSSFGPVLAEALLHLPDGSSHAGQLLRQIVSTAPQHPVNQLICLLLDTGNTDRAVCLVRPHGEVAPPPCGQITTALMALSGLSAMVPVCHELIHHERWENKRASGWEESTQGMWTALTAYYDQLHAPEHVEHELQQAIDSGDPGARHVLARRLQRASREDSALRLLGRTDSASWSLSSSLDPSLCGALRIRLLHQQERWDEAALDLLLTVNPLLLNRLASLDPQTNAPEISDVLWCVRASAPELEPGYLWQYRQLQRAIGEQEH